MNFHTREIGKSFVTIVTCKWISSCFRELFFWSSFLVFVHLNLFLFRFSFLFFIMICHYVNIHCTFCIESFIAILTENIFDIRNNFTLFSIQNSNFWSVTVNGPWNRERSTVFELIPFALHFGQPYRKWLSALQYDFDFE